tara:strand:+ start:116 stop:715 length:600 start_codon:yes stop_codon:yes gene_type:complete
MAVTLKQVESLPEAYPEIEIDVFGQSPDATIWQRIESYIAHRFTPRAVVWIVEGEGDWTPPLTPATVETVEVWESGAWVSTVAIPSPYGGLCFVGDGPYRVTATAGPDGVDIDGVLTFPVPDIVVSAVRRLNQYLLVEIKNDEYGNASGSPKHWATSLARTGEGENAETETFQRQAAWIAKAMQHSGAGDLLRNYRRAQ